jgi:hypothetical protein
MKPKGTGKKLSEKVKEFSDKTRRDEITAKHAEDSSACEGIIITPEGIERAKEFLEKLASH